MKSFKVLFLAILSFAVIPSHAAPSDMTEISGCLRRAMTTFSTEPSEELIHVSEDMLADRPILFYGVRQEKQALLPFKDFKQALQECMKVKSPKLVQLVGDSNKFSPEGTRAAVSFTTPFFEGDHMLEYGFTGYLNADRGQLDVNSLLNAYVEDHPDQAYRVLGNVVGHSIVALEKWGCRVPNTISIYVMVFNEFGMDEGFTKFGDDVIVSDSLLSAEDGDFLVVIEGGAQSFKQAINVLKNDVPVKALTNVRTEKDREFFSASEFFLHVQKALKADQELAPEAVRGLMNTYMETHVAWNKDRPDAATKEALFYSTMEEFIEKRIYQKLLDKVEITVA